MSPAKAACDAERLSQINKRNSVKQYSTVSKLRLNFSIASHLLTFIWSDFVVVVNQIWMIEMVEIVVIGRMGLLLVLQRNTAAVHSTY